MGAIPGPTLTGFQWFVYNVMQVPLPNLPNTDPVIGYSLGVALAIVNPLIRLLSGGYSGPPIPGVPPISLYVEAVYNLGGDNLVNFAQDQPGFCYFETLRKGFNTNGFVTGVVQASNDEGTGNTLAVMDAYKQFTLANLQNLKTPWGRRYLGIAQSAGPTTGGIS
jgi:hypothetical protein